MKIERILGPSTMARSIERITQDETGAFDVDAVTFEQQSRKRNGSEERESGLRDNQEQPAADSPAERGNAALEKSKSGLNVVA